MKPSSLRLYLLICFLVASMSILSGCSGDGPNGKSLVNSQCDSCHRLDIITNASKNPSDWMITVDRMIGRGTKLDDTERQAVIDYLSETYP